MRIENTVTPTFSKPPARYARSGVTKVYADPGETPARPMVSIYREQKHPDGGAPRIMCVPHVAGARVFYAQNMHAAIWFAISVLHDLGVNIARGL